MELKELFSKNYVKENGVKHLGMWAIHTVLVPRRI